MQISCELWTINRWLRWTGFRLFIYCDAKKGDDPTREPSRIGFIFWGWGICLTKWKARGW